LCQSKIIFFLTGCKTRPGVEVVIRSLLVAKMSDVSCDDHNDLHFEIACISRTICFFFATREDLLFEYGGSINLVLAH
jgi:ethanolamine utilization microcompartment shell protein EutL